MATLPQRPTIGRVVRYVLTHDDIQKMVDSITAPHHHLNGYNAGDEVAGEVVRVHFVDATPSVNLKCRLDGNVPDLWVTGVREGTGPGTWHWPHRD